MIETPPRPDEAWFGFKRVEAEAKSGLVRGVFDSVAGRYDLMNDLMSLGVHRFWKDRMVRRLAPRPGEHMLDVAGGTGDIAFRIIGQTKGRARVSVCDLTPAMVLRGRERAIDRGIVADIDWIAGDAEALPFADMSVDGYTIAFGLRNVTRIGAALREARRVLRPGGRFLCLEFSHVAAPVIDRIYDLYSFKVLPALGAMVAGDGDAYRYLAESIRRFPGQAELTELIAGAGFERAGFENLSGGIAALHSAWRI